MISCHLMKTLSVQLSLRGLVKWPPPSAEMEREDTGPEAALRLIPLTGSRAGARLRKGGSWENTSKPPKAAQVALSLSLVFTFSSSL